MFCCCELILHSGAHACLSIPKQTHTTQRCRSAPLVQVRTAGAKWKQDASTCQLELKMPRLPSKAPRFVPWLFSALCGMSTKLFDSICIRTKWITSATARNNPSTDQSNFYLGITLMGSQLTNLAVRLSYNDKVVTPGWNNSSRYTILL